MITVDQAIALIDDLLDRFIDADSALTSEYCVDICAAQARDAVEHEALRKQFDEVKALLRGEHN